MYSGISELYAWRSKYCDLLVQYEDCKWWEIIKKRTIQTHLVYVYPLMKGEVVLDREFLTED